MSHQLINRSPDLKQLQDEGYHIEVPSGLGYVLAKDIPYVTSSKQVRYDGMLISTLNLTGDSTTVPDVHTIEFAGERPCDKNGQPLNITSRDTPQDLTETLRSDFQFSRKPSPLTEPPYADYYDKMMLYITLLSGPAQALDSSATAQTHPIIQETADDSVFRYADNASTRAGISALTSKLKLGPVAIIGLGGAGSYLLDLVAKTPVKEIHLFDGDTFYQHNAFRAPGAASITELEAKMPKVEYFTQCYDPMRRAIIPHPVFLDKINAKQLLKDMEFAFVCIDDGEAKRAVVEVLEDLAITFIETGIGVQEVNNSLAGIVRITTSTPAAREEARRHISFSDGAANQEYSRNIQIAELNSINAALAVMKWKKLYGFYGDIEQEQHSLYTINDNHILREGKL